jgi:hypothetical protein
MVLTETIRLHLQGVQFRKNVSNTNLKVGDKMIPAGAFVVSGAEFPCSATLLLTMFKTALRQRGHTSQSSNIPGS